MAVVFDDHTGDAARPGRRGRPATGRRAADTPERSASRRPTRRHGAPPARTNERSRPTRDGVAKRRAGDADTGRRTADPAQRRNAAGDGSVEPAARGNRVADQRVAEPTARRNAAGQRTAERVARGNGVATQRVAEPTPRRNAAGQRSAEPAARRNRVTGRRVAEPTAGRDRVGGRRTAEPAASAGASEAQGIAGRARRVLGASAAIILPLDDTPVGEVLAPRPLRSLRPTRPEEEAEASAAPPVPTPSARPTLRTAAPMRTRSHGGAARRQDAVRTTVWPRHHDQPMVRLTAGVVVGPPPPLVVVPRRRRVSRLVAVAFAVIFVLMLGAAAFQTQLARRQVQLDKVERSIRDANQQYNDLRRQRSELRSPERLATAATDLGMRPASSTDFVSIDPQIVAIVQQSVGGVFDPNATVLDPLDEFSRVKAIAGSAP